MNATHFGGDVDVSRDAKALALASVDDRGDSLVETLLNRSRYIVAHCFVLSQSVGSASLRFQPRRKA
jgi:hypothetical protein